MSARKFASTSVDVFDAEVAEGVLNEYEEKLEGNALQRAQIIGAGGVGGF